MAKDADPDWECGVGESRRDPDDQARRRGIRNERRRQFVIVNRPVEGLVLFAYGLLKKELVGAPNWMETERWDVHGVPDVPGDTESEADTQTLIRKLLEERFGLKAHMESKRNGGVRDYGGEGWGEDDAEREGDPNSPPFENEDSNNGHGGDERCG